MLLLMEIIAITGIVTIRYIESPPPLAPLKPHHVVCAGVFYLKRKIFPALYKMCVRLFITDSLFAKLYYSPFFSQ